MNRDYRTIVQDSGGKYVNRVMIGTAVTGLVRIEWVGARYGQIVPTNWSHVEMRQWMDAYYPLRYQVDDAQNLIVKEAVEREFEWLILLEHDTVMPADAFLRLNEIITHETRPVTSGLYFTRSLPSEPLIYRGRGTGSFREWKLGDLVYCDGVPTGILLIDMRVLRLMYQDSEEYTIQYPGGRPATARRVFRTPRDLWFDPESAEVYSQVGTSDLDWCTRLIEGDYMRKAGWGEYVDGLENQNYPLVVDTNLFCMHINPDGMQFPPVEVMAEYVPTLPTPDPSLKGGGKWPVCEVCGWAMVTEPGRGFYCEYCEHPPTLGIHVREGVTAKDKVGG